MVDSEPGPLEGICTGAARPPCPLPTRYPAGTEAVLARPYVGPKQMGGRTMNGWVTVAHGGLVSSHELASWAERSVSFARVLPPK